MISTRNLALIITFVITKFSLECLQALGMQSKKIKDSAIKTGEDAVTSGKEGYYARLNNEKSWCIPNIPGYTGPGEFKSNMYIEVTFSGSHQISAMALQGEGDNSYGKYIRVSYDYAGFFHFYKIDGKTEVSFFLKDLLCYLPSFSKSNTTF